MINVQELRNLFLVLELSLRIAIDIFLVPNVALNVVM